MEQHNWGAYFDKVFEEPDYICENGICDTDALERSNAHLNQRLSQLLTASETTWPEPEETVPVITPTPRSEVTPSRSAVLPLQSNVWNGTELLNYHAQITVGQLPKPFFVALDTGSSLLWIQSQVNQRDAPVEDQSTYIPEHSTTSKNLGKSIDVLYADQSSVTAAVYADEITAGKLTADSQTFGAASTTNIRDAFRKKSSNGIMGLALPVKQDPNLVGIDLSNLVLNLYQSRRVKYASMSIVGPRNNPKNAERIDKERQMQPRGYFIVGSVDPKFYTGHISWLPRQDVNRWIIELNEVIVNDQVVLRNQRALIDTGTAFMLANAEAYKTIMRSIADARSFKPGYFSYPESSLTSIGFKFGERTILLRQSDFSLGQKKYPMNATGAPDTSQPARYVSSIIRQDSWPEDFGNDLWVLGGIFIDNVVVIFDFSGKRIGLADISEDDPQYDPGAFEAV
ncbi:hypothetical protein PMZ80_002057 [Knufia obscura]|uniref:Peptidase A1 domain-containing protein n=2 Tax=Knufia TaxID=430999 RepID=A0AAN8IN53_9EURO|nr:hypothetical protein PMZ80_002057 [Knufia obscura]KAK5953872.1 hypothetical protein OHC33_005143 [Knufia fluminis]